MAQYKKFRDDTPKNAPIWVKRINMMLEKKNMTQAELAKDAQIAPSSLSSWLKSGKGRNYAEPKVSNLKSVAEVLGVSMDYLVGFSDSEKINNPYKAGADVFGLSDKAMERLAKLNERKKFFSKFINFFLENDHFWKAIEPIVNEYFNVLSKKDNYNFDRRELEFIKFTLNELINETMNDCYEAFRRHPKLFYKLFLEKSQCKK